MESAHPQNIENSTGSAEPSSGHSSPEASMSEDTTSISSSKLSSYEKAIRALNERLEYTQLQLSLKELECQALLKENHELKFTRSVK
ncbi:6426_t:CDS:1, partial [Acaulospora colombiana]